MYKIVCYNLLRDLLLQKCIVITINVLRVVNTAFLCGTNMFWDSWLLVIG